MHPYLFRFVQPVTGRPVSVTTYAALMFLGAAVAIGLGTALARRRGLAPFDLFAAGAVAFGVGYLGARALFVVLNGPALAREVGWRAVLLSDSGLVWYGGFASGLLAFWGYARIYRVPLLPALDVAAPALALGHAFGRLGCFTAGCCYGRPSDLPWAVRFPLDSLAPAGVFLHPVQLYEAAGLVLLAAIAAGVLWWARSPGTALWTYLTGYAVLRFVTEIFRGDDRGGFLGPLSPSQVIALGVLLLAATAAILHLRRRRRGAADVTVGVH